MANDSASSIELPSAKHTASSGSTTSFSEPDDIAVFTAVKSNNALSDSTLHAAKSLLPVAEDDLFAIDAEIDRLQELLAELHQRRRTRAAHVTAYRTANAPIRKLANEILAHIFILCCSDSSVSPTYDPKQQQPIIGNVCTRWRNISLDTPQLWTKIHVDRGRYTSESEAATAEPLDTFLPVVARLCHRSGQLPLSISFDNEHPMESYLHPFMQDLARIAELRVHRSPNTLRSLLALPFGALPSLGILYLEDNRVDLNDGYDLFRAPALREFSCEGRLQTTEWMDHLPLGQLTCLCLPSTLGCHLADLLALLSIIPNLIEGVFTVDPTRALLLMALPTLGPDVQVQLPCLQRLDIRSTDRSYLDSGVFHRLVLPNLRHLSINISVGPYWGVKLWTSIIRSASHLESLWVRGPLTPQELLQILILTPNLRELELNGNHRGALTLNSSLLHKLAMGSLLPKLTDLHCSISQTTADDYGILDLHLDMLEQRKSATGASHITNVIFKFEDRVNDKDPDAELRFPGLTRMKGMIQEGWNIRVL